MTSRAAEVVNRATLHVVSHRMSLSGRYSLTYQTLLPSYLYQTRPLEGSKGSQEGSYPKVLTSLKVLVG